MKKFLLFIWLFLALIGFFGGIGYCGYMGAWIPAIGIIALGSLAIFQFKEFINEIME
jgi:hypothetical protein